MTTPVLLWFKRDLRIHDHPALAAAAACGPVCPVHVVEPEYWQGADVSGRQYAFLRECVADLRDQLAQIGLCLTLRVGDAVAVLDTLRRQTGARALFSH